MPLSAIVLIFINLGLIWLLMAVPLGLRTIRVRKRYPVSPERVWGAVYPLGKDARWHPSVVTSEQAGDGLVRQSLSHQDRQGRPIERVMRLDPVELGVCYSAQVVDDSALDAAFWSNYSEVRRVNHAPEGSELIVEQTDRYRGLAFLVFRYFALLREVNSLGSWFRTGRATTGGIFEHPATQVALAVLSTLLLWPFFGLTSQGLMLSTILTVVIVLHEAGHLLAYRVFGHEKVRMIFVPFLGGIAIGGRPYNSIFEVAVSALMGPGMSGFLVPVVIGVHEAAETGWISADAEAPSLLLLLVLGAFNLLNLLPMYRFDGGQVLRQIFPGRVLQLVGTFLIAAAILFTAWRIELPRNAILAGLSVFTLVSFMGLRTGRVRPRFKLIEMSGGERLMVGLGLYAAVMIHAYAIIYACDRLFG